MQVFHTITKPVNNSDLGSVGPGLNSICSTCMIFGKWLISYVLSFLILKWKLWILVSDLSCKELRSCHPILTTGIKLEKLKNENSSEIREKSDVTGQSKSDKRVPRITIYLNRNPQHHGNQCWVGTSEPSLRKSGFSEWVNLRVKNSKETLPSWGRCTFLWVYLLVHPEKFPPAR